MCVPSASAWRRVARSGLGRDYKLAGIPSGHRASRMPRQARCLLRPPRLARMTISLSIRVGTCTCSIWAVNRSPLIGPLRMQGASALSCRRAAMKVSAAQGLRSTRHRAICLAVPSHVGGHVGLDPDLFDEHQAAWINLAFIGLPAGLLAAVAERDYSIGTKFLKVSPSATRAAAMPGIRPPGSAAYAAYPDRASARRSRATSCATPATQGGLVCSPSTIERIVSYQADYGLTCRQMLRAQALRPA